METKYKIHLWVVDEGWKLFEVDRNSKELKDRNISIGDRASIGDGASIGYRASIGDHVKLIKCIYIMGSKYPVTYVGNKRISVGCHTHTFTEWLRDYKKIAKSDNASQAVIKEYKGYIDTIIKIIGRK